jgi:hypothetical protein
VVVWINTSVSEAAKRSVVRERNLVDVDEHDLAGRPL